MEGPSISERVILAGARKLVAGSSLIRMESISCPTRTDGPINGWALARTTTPDYIDCPKR